MLILLLLEGNPSRSRCVFPARFSPRRRGSPPTDSLDRVQGPDGPLVGIERLHEPMRQVGQGLSKFGVSSRFRVAFGILQDPEGRPQLATDGLQVLPNLRRVCWPAARRDPHGMAGKLLAERVLAQQITSAVLDRGGLLDATRWL